MFHLAAQTIVGTANRSPLSTFETNMRGTYMLLEACRAVGVVGDPVERIVVASSDKAYGAHDELPYREDFALQPTLPVRRLEGLHGPDRPLVRDAPTACRWRSPGSPTSTAAATSTGRGSCPTPAVRWSRASAR